MPRTSVISAFINDNASGGNGSAGPDGTQYYVELTIQSSQVSSDLTNFPVYVDLSTMPADFFVNVQSDGGDIRVTESDGTTRCPVDLVSINTGTSTGELHFLASSVSSSSNTIFRIYYDAGGGLSQPAVGTTYGRNAVWADYEVVFHADDDVDSTGKTTLTTTGATVGDTVGQIGAATDYDGDPERTQTSSVVTLGGTDTPLSAGAWVNIGNQPTSTRLFSNDRAEVWFNDPQDRWAFLLSGSSSSSGYLRRSSSAGRTKGSWAFIHVTYNGLGSTGGMKIYENGVNETDSFTTGTQDLADNTLVIGNNPALNRGLIGAIDEFRIRKSELSSDWVSAEYTNQNTPTTFYSVGSQTGA